MRFASAAVLCATLVLAILMLAGWGHPQPGFGPSDTADYKVLAPISHGNLTIFPVVASRVHDTGIFLTLDEGLRSGEVVITEAGQAQPLLRRRRVPTPQPHYDGAQVNRLVLINNSDRPLLLLAGEIVAGGKQDRVVGKDRIVPANSDPVDLSVFCVEPGRWVASSGNFGGLVGGTATQMAQPSVRRGAMADKNQQKVWSEVATARDSMAASVASPLASPSSSYARVMADDKVRKQVDSVAAPIERSYQSVMRELRRQNAVGVVVGINGEIVWADLFASTPLLEKYWPKLVRSYAAEALTSRARAAKVSMQAAQQFLEDFSGERQVVEIEPGVFRHTEIVGQRFHAFELASLLPKTGYNLHISKMAE